MFYLFTTNLQMARPKKTETSPSPKKSTSSPKSETNESISQTTHQQTELNTAMPANPMEMMMQVMVQMAQAQMQTNELLKKLSEERVNLVQEKPKMTPEQEMYYEYGSQQLEYEIRYQLRVVDKFGEDGQKIYQPLPDMSSFSTVEKAKEYGDRKYP